MRFACSRAEARALQIKTENDNVGLPTTFMLLFFFLYLLGSLYDLEYEPVIDNFHGKQLRVASNACSHKVKNTTNRYKLCCKCSHKSLAQINMNFTVNLVAKI